MGETPRSYRRRHRHQNERLDLGSFLPVSDTFLLDRNPSQAEDTPSKGGSPLCLDGYPVWCFCRSRCCLCAPSLTRRSRPRPGSWVRCWTRAKLASLAPRSRSSQRDQRPARRHDGCGRTIRGAGPPAGDLSHPGRDLGISDRGVDDVHGAQWRDRAADDYARAGEHRRNRHGGWRVSTHPDRQRGGQPDHLPQQIEDVPINGRTLSVARRAVGGRDTARPSIAGRSSARRAAAGTST